MVDCHVHMVLDGEYWKSAIGRHAMGPDRAWIASVLESYRQAGFTWLRDCGDRWGVGALARCMAPDYGITYRTPLASFYKAGHYGGIIGLPFERETEFAQLVRENKRQGADFIKIMISGLMDFDRFGALTEEGLEPAEIKQLIHIAHEEGMSVAVHGNGHKAVLAAAEAGVDSVEHGAYLDGDALAAMAETGTVWVPTLSAIGNLLGKGRFPETAVAQILDSALKNVAGFAQMGGLVACGSDAGAWAVGHGAHTEMDWLSKALGADIQGVVTRGNTAIREKF